MPSNHLILSGPLLLLPSIFPSIRVLIANSYKNIAKVCYYFKVITEYFVLNFNMLPIFFPSIVGYWELKSFSLKF